MMTSTTTGSPSRAAPWSLLLVAGALACSDAVTEPAARLANGSSAVGGTEVEDSALGRSDATRPMKLRLTVAATGEVVPPPTPCLQFFHTVIEGHATHTGRIEGVGRTCVTDAVAPDPSPPFPAPGPGPYLTATFSNPLWELTAANGDQLFLEAVDAVAVISLADGSLRAEGSHTIVGGTGRFAGATGILQSAAVNADGVGPDDFESHGWIRY